MSLQRLGLHVGAVIIFCMKSYINYARNGRCVEDDDDGDHRQIVRGNSTIQIDYTVDKRKGLCYLSRY